jgi:hypothetical protein
VSHRRGFFLPQGCHRERVVFTMNTSIARPTRQRRPLGNRDRFPSSTALPAFIAPIPPTCVCYATHDFLVPNPRPDLTMDPQTLRTIDPGAR